MTDPNTMLRRVDIEKVLQAEIDELKATIPYAEARLDEVLHGPAARYTSNSAIAQRKKRIARLHGDIDCLSRLGPILDKCSKFTVTRIDDEDILLDRRGKAVHRQRVT